MVAFQTSKVRCLDLVRGKLPIEQPLQRNSWFKCQIQKPTAPVVNLALPLPPVQLTKWVFRRAAPTRQNKTEPPFPYCPSPLPPLPSEVPTFRLAPDPENPTIAYQWEWTPEQAISLEPPYIIWANSPSLAQEGWVHIVVIWTLVAAATGSSPAGLGDITSGLYSVFLSTCLSSATSSSVRTQKQSFWVTLVIAAKWKQRREFSKLIFSDRMTAPI